MRFKIVMKTLLHHRTRILLAGVALAVLSVAAWTWRLELRAGWALVQLDRRHEVLDLARGVKLLRWPESHRDPAIPCRYRAIRAPGSHPTRRSSPPSLACLPAVVLELAYQVSPFATVPHSFNSRPGRRLGGLDEHLAPDPGEFNEYRPILGHPRPLEYLDPSGGS